MYYHTIQHYEPEKFKRLTGVSKETFVLMRQVLRLALPTLGRPTLLCREDRLLMAFRKRFGLRFNLLAAICNLGNPNI